MKFPRRRHLTAPQYSQHHENTVNEMQKQQQLLQQEQRQKQGDAKQRAQRAKKRTKWKEP